MYAKIAILISLAFCFKVAESSTLGLCQSNIDRLRSDLIVILKKTPAMPPLAKLYGPLKSILNDAETSKTEGKYRDCVENTERGLKVSKAYAR